MKAYLCAALLVAGCNTPVKPKALPVGTSKDAGGIVARVKASSEALGASAEATRAETARIDHKVAELKILSPASAPELASIGTSTVAINAEADKVTAVALDLGEQRSKLGEAVVHIQQLEQAIVQRDASLAATESALVAANEKLTEAKAKEQGALRRVLLLLVGLGVLVVAVSAGLCFYGNANAIGIGIAGAALSLTALTFSWLLANMWCLLVVVGVVVVYACYQVWVKRRDEHIAFEQTKTTELVKASLPVAERERLFGGKIDGGVVGSIQSPPTKAKVRALRAKLAEATRSLTV